MSTWVVVLSVFAIYIELVEGEYGEKLSSNNTDSSASYEEFYEDFSEEIFSTTPDDGVVIEKAILAAEITPKASYSLVDTPRRSPRVSFNGYSDASSSVSVATKHNLNSHLVNADSTATSTDSSFRYSSSATYDSIKTSTPNFTIRVFSPDSHHQQNLHSSPYRSSDNLQTTSAKATEVQHNGYGIYDDGSYNPLTNGDFSHLGYTIPANHQSWSPYISSHSPEFLAEVQQANQRLEQERLSQIEATKLYLMQVKTAREYAAKVQAMQEALREVLRTSHQAVTGWTSNEAKPSYLPPTASLGKQQPIRSKVVSRTEAPGVSNFGYQNSYSGNSIYSSQPGGPQQAAHVNALADGGWRVSASPTRNLPAANFYSGPTATPVVLPSGFLADTDAVTQARLAHLKALMNAIEAASQWKKSAAPKRWS